jgi:hypothetical protein
MIAEALAATGATTEIQPPGDPEGDAAPPPPATEPVEPAPQAPPAAEPPPVETPEDTPPVGDEPAAGEGPAATAEEMQNAEPLIARVIRQLPGTPVPPHVSRRRECRLTPEQAALQGQLYTVVTTSGLNLRNQAEVYGWLLDQFGDVIQ